MRTFTPRVEGILSSADKLAAEWGHDYIGTEHLLLALLADPDGLAAQVLQELGVAERTVQRLEQIMNSDEYNRPSRRLEPRQGAPTYTGMDYDEEKVAEVVLALLHLNAFQDGDMVRAWKGFDWDAMDRLHQQGLITDPKSKAKSVLLTQAGGEQARELFEQYFGPGPNN